ncbi:hypothetical protein L484_006849 [Morus notabilis]|uniref:Uncharacterized protein n=1 Tax=Morus notabilis TaxID=981085 RepID=W9R8A4_9ROSA|nr:hypothetical protein L484_006849 [Morus notabilis]
MLIGVNWDACAQECLSLEDGLIVRKAGLDSRNLGAARLASNVATTLDYVILDVQKEHVQLS